MPEHEGLNGLDTKIELKGYFERILNERDRTDSERERRMDERFEQRDKALEAAFKAQQEAVANAFKASTEAVAKAEIAQTLSVSSLKEESQKWQHDHNGLLREMVTQKENFVLKDDNNLLRRELADKIDSAEKRLAAKTDEQDTRLDLMRGKGSGVSSTVTLILAGAGPVLAILFFAILNH